MSDISEKRKAQVAQALREWGGAHTQFWSYTTSHATLEVRLHRKGVRGNLHLVCVGCSWIEGATTLPSATLEIEETGDAEEGRYVVREMSGRMKVVCGLVSVERDVEPVY
jgi:hypothetical protein